MLTVKFEKEDCSETHAKTAWSGAHPRSCDGATCHLDGATPGKLSSTIFQKHGLETMRRRLGYVDISPPGLTVTRVNEFFQRKPADRPFFLWVNFNDPHHPWDQNAIPQPHDRKKLPVPRYLPDLPRVREDLGRYYDEVARMDGEFPTVLDILQGRGFAQNTLVLFMGDNGFALPHGKGTLYDPGLNVPCLVRSARYKLIYNCTPQMKYSPVDSYTERSWLEITDEHLWGRLAPAFDRTYFGARPVLELYDLEADPAELDNLAGRPALSSVQRRLLEALQEKMILDWDFLPLPLNE